MFTILSYICYVHNSLLFNFKSSGCCLRMSFSSLHCNTKIWDLKNLIFSYKSLNSILYISLAFTLLLIFLRRIFTCFLLQSFSVCIHWMELSFMLTLVILPMFYTTQHLLSYFLYTRIIISWAFSKNFYRSLWIFIIFILTLKFIFQVRKLYKTYTSF